MAENKTKGSRGKSRRKSKKWLTTESGQKTGKVSKWIDMIYEQLWNGFVSVHWCALFFEMGIL